MTRHEKIVLPDVAHHITQHVAFSMNISSSDEDRAFYLDHLLSALVEFGFSFLSYGLMRNHIHHPVIPERKAGLGLRIRLVTSYYSGMVDVKINTLGSLFQRWFFYYLILLRLIFAKKDQNISRPVLDFTWDR